MERFKLDPQELKKIESSRIAMGVYQFVAGRLVMLAASRGFSEMYGQTPAQRLKEAGTGLFRYIHPDDLAYIQNQLLAFASGKAAVFKAIYRIKTPIDEDYTVVQAQGKHRLQRGHETIVIWFAKESSQRLAQFFRDDEASEPVLKQKPMRQYYDVLTGLPSTSYFYELADAGTKRMFKEGKRPVVLAFNLIGFRQFNRQYSYSEGNQLLIAFADLLRRTFTNENCARFDEDNFYAYTSENNLDARLRKLLQQARTINHGQSLCVRIGVYDEANLTYEDIKSVCDYAMLACNRDRKQVGSHIAYFEKDSKHEIEFEDYILSNFDQALKEGWIEPYYQPIVRILNGQTGNWEALARWRDPESGTLRDEQFIPILDRANVLYRLDLYMIERVIADLQKLKQRGCDDIAISINLFSSEFEQFNMAEAISRKFKESGLSPELLVIEITNDIRALDLEKIQQQMEIFEQNGFSVWVDNFGEGYSSIGIMKQSLPITCIKFGASFMNDADQKRSKVVLKKMIEMAEELGIDTVVEGVENADQLLVLREIGCSAVQGYYFGLPKSFEEAYRDWIVGPDANVEHLEESNYYNVMGMLSLDRPRFKQEIQDPSLSFEEDDPIFEKYFKGTPIGLIEYRDGKMYYVRGNEGYTQYLISCGSVTLKEMEEDPFSTELKEIGPQYLVDVKEWIKEEYWHDHRTKWHFSVHSFPNNLYVEGYQRIISRNPNTGAFAMVDVLTSYNANQVYHQKARNDLGVLVNFNLNTDQYRDMPMPYLIVTPVYRKGKPVDMQYVYVNQAYADVIGQTRERLLSSRMSKFTTEKDFPYWMSEFAKTAKTRKLQTGIFKNHYGHWYEYVVAPASVPDAYSLVLINIDKQKQSELELEKKQQTNKEIIQLSERLNVKNSKLETAIADALGTLGRDIGADRFYLMETDQRFAKNTYEWVRHGIASAQAKQQYVNITSDGHGLKKGELAALESMVLTDPAEIKAKFPDIIASYTDYEVKNLMFAAFYESGAIKGFVVAENFDADLNIDFKNLIELTADFLGAKIISRNLELQRDTDVLTGLNDRHPYLAKVKRYRQAEASQGIGVVYCDLNGLKETNDQLGHPAGDALLIKAGNFLSENFDHRFVYRVGGDEFVILDDENTRLDFLKKCHDFARKLTKPDTPSISIGVEWCADSHKLEEAISSADRKMQEAKNEYYKKHKRYR